MIIQLAKWPTITPDQPNRPSGGLPGNSRWAEWPGAAAVISGGHGDDDDDDAGVGMVTVFYCHLSAR